MYKCISLKLVAVFDYKSVADLCWHLSLSNKTVEQTDLKSIEALLDFYDSEANMKVNLNN